jgi:hypothetical protein
MRIMNSLEKRNKESASVAIIVLVVLLGFFTSPCNGQEDTVKNKKDFKNSIKINLSNPMLFSPKFNVIGYERVVNAHQTFSVNFGRFALGNFFAMADSIGLTDQYDDKGINFSVDYRFYLRKENKYNAPHGVYIGPYYAFNYFSRTLEWDVNTSSLDGKVTTGFDLTANLIGAQLGYQFLLGKRISLDMILMGPGLWFFKVKSRFETTLDPEDQEMLLEQLNEMLKNKFPGSDYVFTGGSVEAKKTTSTATMGLRYMINLGFRF